MKVYIIGTAYETAEILSKADINKQINECAQIVKALNGKMYVFKKNNITRMYYHYKEWLELYIKVLDHYRNGIFGIAKKYSDECEKIKPPFHVPMYFDNIKRELFTKDKKTYERFREYGTTAVEFLFINGEWSFMRYGKRVHPYEIGIFSPTLGVDMTKVIVDEPHSYWYKNKIQDKLVAVDKNDAASKKESKYKNEEESCADAFLANPLFDMF